MEDYEAPELGGAADYPEREIDLWWEMKKGRDLAEHYARSFVPPEVARDIAIDVWIRIRNAYWSTPETLTTSLIVTVTRNVCLDYRRTPRNRTVSLDSPAENAPEDAGKLSDILAADARHSDPALILEHKETVDRVLQSILDITARGTAPADATVIWVLARIHGMPNRSIRCTGMFQHLSASSISMRIKAIDRLLWSVLAPSRLAADQFTPHFVRNRPRLVAAVEAALRKDQGTPDDSCRRATKGIAEYVAQSLISQNRRLGFLHGTARERDVAVARALCEMCLDSSWRDSSWAELQTIAEVAAAIKAARQHQRYAEELYTSGKEEAGNIEMSRAIVARAKVLTQLLPEEVRGGRADTEEGNE